MIGKFATNTLWMLLMIVVSGLVYIRLASHDAMVLHVSPPTGATLDTPVIMQGSALFVQAFAAPPDTVLHALDRIALATPRTSTLKGDVKEGMITYITRSRVFGFPDYTTVQVIADGQGSRVTLYGRLRFGRSDFGVNEARIRGWLKALKALDEL